MKKLRFVTILLAALMLLSLTACGKKTPESIQAVIDVKDYGVMTFDLYSDKAPITVARFVELAESGYFDGLTFHRISKDFVVQGGDPTGTGVGGSGVKIKGEFAANGVDNDLSHVKGVLSMARAKDYNSADSQFFICTSDLCKYSLDGLYAGFGMMTDGEDVLDALNSIPTDAYERPLEVVTINSITIIK